MLVILKLVMKINFLTYSEPNMTTSRRRCVESAHINGADIIHEFCRGDIDNDFYEKNIAILNAEFCENGTRPCAGYWLWKPYFINRIMTEANDGDIICYVDAGVEIIANLNHIVKVMDQDIFLFTNGLQHVQWCKADVMQEINGGMLPLEYTQVQASAMFFRVNDFTRKFVAEWLRLCQVQKMIDDSPSDTINFEGFAAHRYDQAILSCMAYREGIKGHYWPDAKWFSTQRYRWPNDNYPLMFCHHRMRNEEY